MCQELRSIYLYTHTNVHSLFSERYHLSPHTHTHTYIHIYNQPIGLMSRVLANGPGDRGSIPARVIPKTRKMVLHTALLNTQHYKVRIKGKVEQSRNRNEETPSSTLRCSSYWKGSLRVSLDKSRQLLMYIDIYIYTHTYTHIHTHI